MSHFNSIWKVPFMLFHKKIYMKFFIQTNVSVWIHKLFFGKTLAFWKITKIEREDLFQKYIFSVSQNTKWNEKKYFGGTLKNEYIFLPKMYHCNLLSSLVPLLLLGSMLPLHIYVPFQCRTMSNVGIVVNIF